MELWLFDMDRWRLYASIQQKYYFSWKRRKEVLPISSAQWLMPTYCYDADLYFGYKDGTFPYIHRKTLYY